MTRHHHPRSRRRTWSRRGHRGRRPSVVSLLFGIVFTSIGLDALFPADGGFLGGLDVGLILALTGIVGGLLLLASAAKPPRRHAATTVGSGAGADEATPHIPAPPLPTPAAVREEDRPWFEQDEVLSEAEREVLAALEEEERRAGRGGTGTPGSAAAPG